MSLQAHGELAVLRRHALATLGSSHVGMLPGPGVAAMERLASGTGGGEMIRLRPAGERGRTDWSGLDSRHTFPFGEYLGRSGNARGPRGPRPDRDDEQKTTLEMKTVVIRACAAQVAGGRLRLALRRPRG